MAILACLLLGIGAIIPVVHGQSPTIFAVQTVTCSGACAPAGATIGGPSEIVIVGQQSAAVVCPALPATFVTISDTFGNSYSGIQCVNVSAPAGGGTGAIWMAAAASTQPTGMDTITVNCSSCAFTIFSITQFVAFGASSTFASQTNSGSDTRSISISGASLILGGIIFESNSVSCGSITLTSGQTPQQSFPCQTVSGQGSTNGFSTSQTPINAGAFTDSISWSCSGCNVNGGGVARFIQELKGSQTGNTSTLTQCYGNCGTPAVTLANTNSTHSINWNASLTLFYEFQSNLNGFINNVTFSLAKNIQNPQVVAVGVYTIPSCTNGFVPFTQSCPGSLVQSGNTGISALKGKFSLTLNQGAVSVTIGQWVGIALSATIAGCCDVNDTNAAVPIFQTVGGVPAIITQSTSFNTAFKMGLWAFITGQTVGAPPTGTGSACVSNFAQIDCLLPALVNNFCNLQTPACITTSALVWTPILAIIFLIITLAAFSTFSPGVQISFREAENIFLIFLMIVVFMMTDQGLLPIWVDLAIFMAVAVMFGKQVQGKVA